MSTLYSVDKRDAPRRARAAARAETTSDLVRPRRMYLVAAIAALAVGVALFAFAPSAGLASPGALARPHVRAKLTCDACHASARVETACVRCHGAHPSARAAHAALASRGELACTTCHSAHAAPQGVTFLANGAFVRWGGAEEQSGASDAHVADGTTVPLVALSACARCHDRRTGDPIAACVAPGARVSSCFDEHRHAEARYVAWDAAREAARQIPWVASRDQRRLPWTWLGFAAASAVSAALVLSLRARRRGSDAALADAAPAEPPRRVRLPQIDASRCLGCHACVDACAFDVLEIQRYVAVVARPNDCCGAVTCQSACPNGSLVVTEGAAIGTRAIVDAHLESIDARGVFLAGDLTGMPLIKNAIAQGTRVVDRIASTIERGPRDVADVVVVGAGPAGLSALLRAKERGLSAVALEQATVASSVRSFPRGKLVYDPPLDLPIVGELWLREATKEELVAQWTRIVRARRLDVRENHRVKAIEREDGVFALTVSTPEGERVVRGRRVVLAIGRRGTPRRLGAPVAADAESSVAYSLADARSYAGARVLVVGLGDSAMEAACALARQPGTSVTISYRGGTFARGKARNIAELRALVASGRVRLVFESHVERVDRGRVRLATPSGRVDVDADAVIALIGGAPSWALVEAAGVKVAERSEVGPSDAALANPDAEVKR
jgi:thioredoxin reductase/ferredoxin